MKWLETFKKQNQLSIAVAGFLFIGAVGLTVYAGSGTKYDVIEYCFKPEKINNPKNKYCTDDLKFIAPKGFFNQEKYTPANPRFQRGVFLISNKLTRLREIPATNPLAINYTVVAVFLCVAATFILAQRAKRYKYEFAAFYSQLETDLHYEITAGQQSREVRSHLIETETNYIKDTITMRDEMQRYLDKPQSQREFEAEQAEKNNEVVELNRQLEITRLRSAIAELQAKEAGFLKTIKQPTIETTTPDKIDYEALCPGKVGELEYYDWRDLIDDAVGIILAGNSGSGKTSVACWVAGWLTKDNPSQVLALDPHGKVNVLWEELNIHVIKDFSKVQKQLELLIKLLDERRNMDLVDLKQQPQIIVFAEELNACIEEFNNPEIIKKAIKRIGSEGRKYGIVLIAVNQSSNATDIGVSKQYLANYLIIMLNATARHFANLNWKKEDPRYKKINELAYSCVVGGSVPDAIAIHPTHHTYRQFRKIGNKPVGLLPINQLPLTIELAEEITEEKDWYEVFVEMRSHLGRVPSIEEIKVKWEEVMEGECSSKQAELIHEHLLKMEN